MDSSKILEYHKLFNNKLKDKYEPFSQIGINLLIANIKDLIIYNDDYDIKILTTDAFYYFFSNNLDRKLTYKSMMIYYRYNDIEYIPSLSGDFCYDNIENMEYIIRNHLFNKMIIISIYKIRNNNIEEKVYNCRDKFEENYNL
jgi:hypothetical protein